VATEIVARVHGTDHPHAGDKIKLAVGEGIIHLFDVESGARLN
ncbi:MAG: hypothetical protein RIQ44_391, partial [Actinomycetota bacterium]